MLWRRNSGEEKEQTGKQNSESKREDKTEKGNRERGVKNPAKKFFLLGGRIKK